VNTQSSRLVLQLLIRVDLATSSIVPFASTPFFSSPKPAITSRVEADGSGVWVGRSAARAFVAAAQGRLKILVHAGAESTADTVRPAEHAARIGADGVAVIAPPYFRLDDLALRTHLRGAPGG
jgi:Dihydrodipicolinate synthetase family